MEVLLEYIAALRCTQGDSFLIEVNTFDRSDFYMLGNTHDIELHSYSDQNKTPLRCPPSFSGLAIESASGDYWIFPTTLDVVLFLIESSLYHAAIKDIGVQLWRNRAKVHDELYAALPGARDMLLRLAKMQQKVDAMVQKNRQIQREMLRYFFAIEERLLAFCQQK